MPFIQNCALDDIPRGNHKDPGENSMLIQIMDVFEDKFPKPKHQFREIRRFTFIDAEKGDDMFDDWGIKEDDAKRLARLLKEALAKDMNVIVHCVAGICRSGAVTEAGVALGFEDTKRFRQPNVTVKNMVLKELGLSFNPDESPFKAWEQYAPWSNGG